MSEIRDYELTLILDPKLKDKDFKGLEEKIEKLLKDAKVKIEKKDDWGTKDLAYPISKSNQGRYLFFVLKADPSSFVELEKKLRLEEKIIRYLLVRN